MRVISGIFKGKKILQPKDHVTRPLKDLTKESIFNLIKHSKLINIKLENSSILDLFSGVGSFGLECFSRGASLVTFFENYEDVLSVLKKNIDSLKITAINNANNKIMSKYTNINTIIVETQNNSFIITPNINSISSILSISLVIDNQETDITQVFSKYLIDNVNISKHQMIEILKYNKINYENTTTLNIIDNNADNYMIDFKKEFILFCNSNSNTPLISIIYL